jgi:hypothetical protein
LDDVTKINHFFLYISSNSSLDFGSIILSTDITLKNKYFITLSCYNNLWSLNSLRVRLANNRYSNAFTIFFMATRLLPTSTYVSSAAITTPYDPYPTKLIQLLLMLK